MSATRAQHVVWDEIESRPLFDFGDRVTFKALTGQAAQIMRVELEAGVVFPNPGDPAEQEVHPNEQISTVLSGRMRLVVDGEERVVSAGESVVIPANLPHSAVFLEDTVMLEVFVPPVALGDPTP